MLPGVRCSDFSSMSFSAASSSRSSNSFKAKKKTRNSKWNSVNVFDFRWYDRRRSSIKYQEWNVVQWHLDHFLGVYNIIKSIIKTHILQRNKWFKTFPPHAWFCMAVMLPLETRWGLDKWLNGWWLGDEKTLLDMFFMGIYGFPPQCHPRNNAWFFGLLTTMIPEESLNKAWGGAIGGVPLDSHDVYMETFNESAGSCRLISWNPKLITHEDCNNTARASQINTPEKMEERSEKRGHSKKHIFQWSFLQLPGPQVYCLGKKRQNHSSFSDLSSLQAKILYNQPYGRQSAV